MDQEPCREVGLGLSEEQQRVTNAVEGRWLLDVGLPPADPASNEFTLADGRVAVSQTGQVAGHYDVQPGQLLLILPMCAIGGEDPRQIVVRLVLPEPLAPVDWLPGIMESIKPDEPTFVAGTCVLVRRGAEA
jgi:hypothetical protein